MTYDLGTSHVEASNGRSVNGDTEPVYPPPLLQDTPKRESGKIKVGQCDVAGNPFRNFQGGNYSRQGGVMLDPIGEVSDSTRQEEPTELPKVDSDCVTHTGLTHKTGTQVQHTIPWYDTVRLQAQAHNPLKRVPPTPTIAVGSCKRARFVEPCDSGLHTKGVLSSPHAVRVDNGANRASSTATPSGSA